MISVCFKLSGMTQLGVRIRAERKKLGWTQADLAKRVGVTPQAIQVIERGAVKKPQNLTRIAKELGVNPEFLLDGTSFDSAVVPVVGIARAGSGEIDYSTGQGNLGEVEAPEMRR